MKYHGVSVYTNNDFVFTCPRMYYDGEWKYGTFYIWNGSEWKMVGGACAQMIKYIESNNGEEYNNDTIFLVRQEYPSDNMLFDSNTNTLYDINHVSLNIAARGED